MNLSIEGWARNHGKTNIINSAINNETTKIKHGEGISGHTLTLSRGQDEIVRILYGPKRLNMHGNYMIDMSIAKEELFDLLIMSVEGSPFEAMLIGIKQAYSDSLASAARLKAVSAELAEKKRRERLQKLQERLRGVAA
jgi:hypothetical protein